MSCEDYEDDALWLGKGHERVASLTRAVRPPDAVAGGGVGLRRLAASVRRAVHDTYEQRRGVRWLLRRLGYPRTFGHDDS